MGQRRHPRQRRHQRQLSLKQRHAERRETPARPAGGGALLGPALTLKEAQWLALEAQGLAGSRKLLGSVHGILRRLGAVQLDTISVLARSHELVAYARLGPVGRPAVEKAYWGSPHEAIETWAHAASLIPMEDWPYFASRRRQYRQQNERSYPTWRKLQDQIVARIRDEGPLTVSDLGGARRGPGWWNRSEAKDAVELSFMEGALVCVERRGWKRVYDVPERVIPEALLGQELSDEECWRILVENGVGAMGVATLADIADYFRLSREQTKVGMDAAVITPVQVAGWREQAWTTEEGLASLNDRGRRQTRTTLLSPFDSLIWSRKRTTRLFEYTHVFEPYVRAGTRLQGYFTMPLLTGGRIRGWVDPARDGSTLLARNLSVERTAVSGMAAALKEAAQWVGCTAVRLERVEPEEMQGRLVDLLNQ